MSGSEYLLEVRAEEIPARMLAPAAEQLASRALQELEARRAAPAEVESGFTPRRLVLVLRGLPESEPDQQVETVGPPANVAWDADGKPTKALLGFAKRCEVPAKAIERHDTGKGEYAVARKVVAGRAIAAVLAELMPRLLREIAWAKTMRWAASSGPWVRPVHGVLSLLDGVLVPFELFGVTAGTSTAGHPVLSPEPFAVTGWDDYREQLSQRGISVCFAERRAAIESSMRTLAKQAGGSLSGDPELLDKLASICEIPGVLCGRFAEEFLQLPGEVLRTSLRDHQSALTAEAESGLLPVFLTVMDRPDDPAGRVASGNEWVVAARLQDARFFYQEDRKVPMVERARRLGHLTFHDRLGSYADKAVRLEALAAEVAQQLGWDGEVDAAREAARLLKADLLSEMVKEFTSLQGVMGGIYAREEGFPRDTWQAIYEQYLPASTSDPLPTGRVGRAVAISDRVDTLVGLFGIGVVPRGSKDPFGLRRAAQGVLRILLEGDLRLDLTLLCAKAVRLYGDRLTRTGEETLEALRPFLRDRVRHLLSLSGYQYDEIEAALAVGSSDLPDLRARVDAVHRVRGEARFLDVVLAAKRIANIVKDAPEGELDRERLEDDAEKALFQAYGELKEEVDEATEAGEYEASLRRVADLAEVLDRFFVEVLVMAEDPAVRQNRIALLQSIQRTVSRTAQLTEIVVDRADYRDRAEPNNKEEP